MNRRNFLTGLAGILASQIAPPVLPAGSIMRIKPILLPGVDFAVFPKMVPVKPAMDYEYVGRLIWFVEGPRAGEQSLIRDYKGGVITTVFGDSPGPGDKFVVV